MIKTYKIKLKPNNKQQTKMLQFCGAKRFAYNWTLVKQEENYKNGGKFIKDSELRKEFTVLRNSKEYEWLKDVSSDVPKQAIKDACLAYKRFFKGQSKHPKFKTKKNNIQSFYQDNFKIQISNSKVFLSNIGWVKIMEKNKLPIGKGKLKEISVINPRITFDGINWWISIGIEYNDSIEIPKNDGIGIDLGVKDLAICSDKITYKNINKTKNVKKLEKKIRRLQRKISKKYLINKKGDSYCKTSNIIKSEKELLKLNQKLSNIRNDYLHKTTSSIINRKPKFITIEDLNVNGMMKNRHLSKAIQQQKLYEFRRQLEYKCKWNNIELRIVDRFYPSSKLCHECGAIKKDLKLSDRVYICEECGCVLDRDYNASLNLRDAEIYKIAQ